MNGLEVLRGKVVSAIKINGAVNFRIEGKLIKLIGYQKGWTVHGGDRLWVEFANKDVDSVEGDLIFLK